MLAAVALWLSLPSRVRPGPRVQARRTRGGRPRGRDRRRHAGRVRDRRPTSGWTRSSSVTGSGATGSRPTPASASCSSAPRSASSTGSRGAATGRPSSSSCAPRGRPDVRARVRVRRRRALRRRTLHSHGAADGARIPRARLRNPLRASRARLDPGHDERRGGGRPRATAPPGRHRHSGGPRLAEATSPSEAELIGTAVGLAIVVMLTILLFADHHLDHGPYAEPRGA